jgi:hypothetical protein
MNSNFIKSVILFIILFIPPSYSTLFGFAKVDTLALVNGQPITSDDFENRFELTVYPGKDISDNLYAAKRGFLQSMIAEKLLSNSAMMKQKFQGEEQIKKQMERIFLRDALYRKEVLPKVKISKSEISRGIKFSSYYYIVDSFYMPDSSAAKMFYKTVIGKYNKNIYRVVDSLNVNHDTLQIGYGEASEIIEKSFFGNDTGYISKPALTNDGWVIFKILDKEINKKYTGANAEDRAEMVRKIIEERKEIELGYKYLMSVMKGVNVKVNYDIFRPLVYSIQKLISTHHPTNYEPDYYLSSNEILMLKEKYNAKLSSAMLQFKGGELNLEYIFDQLPLSGFAPKDTSIATITESLHSALRFMAQNHFLEQNALKQGLENSGEVKYNVQMFLNAFRSTSLAQQITDTVKVSRQQATEYFANHKDEVLKGVKLQVQIFRIKNIEEVAEQMNKLNKIKGGVNDTTGSAWIPASQFGELGASLAELKNGSIYGPVYIDSVFTIIRVIDKKVSVSQSAVQNSIQAAQDMLLAKTKSSVLNKYVARLAEEQNVKIYMNRLNDLKVTPIEMLTFRYIGFGGKILAVPALYPREDWIKELKKPENIIP